MQRAPAMPPRNCTVGGAALAAGALPTTISASGELTRSMARSLAPALVATAEAFAARCSRPRATAEVSPALA
jgi:hypothetical protein